MTIDKKFYAKARKYKKLSIGQLASRFSRQHSVMKNMQDGFERTYADLIERLNAADKKQNWKAAHDQLYGQLIQMERWKKVATESMDLSMVICTEILGASDIAQARLKSVESMARIKKIFSDNSALS